MIYDLPTAVTIGGQVQRIRSDYRVILDILMCLNDPDLSDSEKFTVCLKAFYPDWQSIAVADYQEAIKQCFSFIDHGETDKGKKSPRLMDWEQDFKNIVSPVNRTLGMEVRAVEYLHWYTFLSAYYEIGDCLFAQIVRIRDKKAHGKQLDKSEKDWYRRNRQLVDLKSRRTAEDNAFFDEILGRKKVE